MMLFGARITAAWLVPSKPVGTPTPANSATVGYLFQQVVKLSVDRLKWTEQLVQQQMLPKLPVLRKLISWNGDTDQQVRKKSS